MNLAMLGYVMAEGRGASDALLREVAEALRAEGVKLAGAVQVNLETAPENHCHMDLHVLAGGEVVRISQDLGALSEGCRLDPDGLEQVVGLANAALEGGAQLLIINKFGKQEADGRGFRPLIGEALARDVPVLAAVARGSLAGFESFADGMAEALPADVQAVLGWCHKQLA